VFIIGKNVKTKEDSCEEADFTSPLRCHACECGCSKSTASAAPAETRKAKVVEVIHVLRQSTMPSFSKLGVVEANQEIKLAFGASGKILTLSAVKGMKVNKGDVLASLDTTVPQSSIALSQAQIKEVQAKRDKIVR
jgi:multidrug efflux pump subunit AcrA (membrane-fusion protein)